MFITDDSNLDELKTFPRLYQGYLWFQKSCDLLGRLPNRKEIDPIDLSFVLGYEMISEIYRYQGDAKFRLIGSVVEEFTGMGSGSKGRWYSEAFAKDTLGAVVGGLIAILDEQKPFFGNVDYIRADGVKLSYVRLIMPLTTVEGEPEMVFMLFSSFVENNDPQASRDKIASTLR